MKLVKNPPNEYLIDFLQGLLDEAETGELQGIAVVTSMTGNATGNGWAGDVSVMSSIGEMEVLKRDFIDLMVDLRVEVL